MSILLGIDGSGPLSDADYRREMSNSFVSYILRRSPVRSKRYLRGPWNDGLDTGMIAAEGLAFVRAASAGMRPPPPILLTGYSRGGAAVIAVAQQLKRRSVPVAAMMLFDAVDRAPTVETRAIPNNVAVVFHARRETGAFTRLSFSNCGTESSRPTVYMQKYFDCTHGGVGGVHHRGGRPGEYIREGLPEHTPTFVTYAQDLAGARRAWAWAEPLLRLTSFL